jgi:hypothetical protein
MPSGCVAVRGRHNTDARSSPARRPWPSTARRPRGRGAARPKPRPRRPCCPGRPGTLPRAIRLARTLYSSPARGTARGAARGAPLQGTPAASSSWEGGRGRVGGVPVGWGGRRKEGWEGQMTEGLGVWHSVAGLNLARGRPGSSGASGWGGTRRAAWSPLAEAQRTAGCGGERRGVRAPALRVRGTGIAGGGVDVQCWRLEGAWRFGESGAGAAVQLARTEFRVE